MRHIVNQSFLFENYSNLLFRAVFVNDLEDFLGLKM